MRTGTGRGSTPGPGLRYSAPVGRLSIAGYYAILDVRLPSGQEVPPARIEAELQRAKELLAARPCVLQLRAKGADDATVLALGRALASLCREQGIPFCLNDRADLAFLCGADVVHVGQEDLPLGEVRKVLAALGRPLPVGVSTHNLAQAEAAARAGADYLGFGPIFATGSKANPDPVVGLAGLRQVCAQVSCPVVAIGGLRRASIVEVVAAGAAAAAVIGDVDTSNDRAAAGRAIGAAFGRAQHV